MFKREITWGKKGLQSGWTILLLQHLQCARRHMATRIQYSTTHSRKRFRRKRRENQNRGHNGKGLLLAGGRSRISGWKIKNEQKRRTRAGLGGHAKCQECQNVSRKKYLCFKLHGSFCVHQWRSQFEESPKTSLNVYKTNNLLWRWVLAQSVSFFIFTGSNYLNLTNSSTTTFSSHSTTVSL